MNFLEVTKSIDNKYYVNTILDPLVHTIKWIRRFSGTSKIKILYDNIRTHVHSNVNEYINSVIIILNFFLFCAENL